MLPLLSLLTAKGLDTKSAADSITILYGSETGNAEEQAKNLMQDILARGMKATVGPLDDFEFEERVRAKR